MNPQTPKLIRYLLRDKVDLILLLVLISLLITQFGSYSLMEGVLSMFILYILGAMWRMGTAMDIINDNVMNIQVRKQLGLHPIAGSYYNNKKPILSIIFDFIFWGALLFGLTYFVITF